MLIKANIDIPETLSVFRTEGLQVSFLVPTETSLKKSIMDATQQFREFLSNSGIHNFDNQKQGITNKKIVETILISKDNFFQTKTSLYRPETKKGDPRIWVYELSKFASQGDLLAFLSAEDRLIVINCSNSNLIDLIKSIKSRIPNILSFKTSSASDELLSKMKQISNRGFIKSLRSGDTGVGFTLETLLGIPANSSKTPDYKGIEIKSSRTRNKKGTLFSMVPNWKLSNIKSADELVLKHGRPNPKWNNLKTIFHTIKGNKENNWGLKLNLDENFIHQVFKNNGIEEKDVCWLLEDFESRISKKHKETFWVEVETRGTKVDEEFHYKKLIHTGDIDVSNIPFLISNGIISLDYLLWERREGWKQYTSKSGFDFLWKIENKNKDLLFKFVKEHPL
ncbi:MvaI/BcnI family restriction endonuclease [Gammaproteobacteria bacterium]|nr:MvaI/BcnI family restriction endonuclease [Gammaproteobacteria bacterium]